MSVSRWLGGTGRMADASNWSDGGVPKSGDTALIRGGDVIAMGEGAGVNVVLDGLSASGAPHLSLVGGSIGSITVNAQQYSTYNSSYGIVDVQGRVTETGGMSLGGPNKAPVTLMMKLSPGSTFVSKGAVSVLNGSNLTETGEAHSSFENDGQIQKEGPGTVKFGSDVTGTGRITNSSDGINTSGKIEFGGSVSAGQLVNITMGTVQVDKPMQFHATVYHLGYGSTNDPLNGSLILEHTKFDSAAFVHGTSEMVLKEGGKVVADLHLSIIGTEGSLSLWATPRQDGSTVISSNKLPDAGSILVQYLNPHH